MNKLYQKSQANNRTRSAGSNLFKSASSLAFALLTAGLLFFSASPVLAGDADKTYDIVIENGKIIDGTGNPWYYGDIGIIGDKIIKIGCLKESMAQRRIDVNQMFVSPGFIDIHTHSDNVILRIPTADNSVRQGLTTIVAGNCGGSSIAVADFLKQVSDTGISINYITLIGHNSVRRQVMGSENRAPTGNELSEMKSIIEKSMQDGAFGLSTGLYYTPGFYAKTSEIIDLAKVAAKYGGIYVSHIRDESDYNIGLLAAIEEAVAVGEQANIRVQVSHLKCLGKPVWHKSDEVLEIIQNARNRGVNVMFDQYPYTASSTGLWGAVVPAWAQEGGTKMFLERLEDSRVKERLRREMRENIERRGGAHTLLVINENAYLSELAENWNMDPVDAAIAIQKNGGSSVISFNMTDYDLENFLKSPFGMVGSDGNISSPGSGGHPRSFGAFPRVLGVYVREKNILTWEEAVRKMTSAPATQLGLLDRGVIRPGMMADIVVFDPEAVSDMATYQDPALDPEGIPYVLVNGKIVIDNASHTGVKSGRVLKKN
jgi:N-acyl-D-amino-acid deacylase